MNLVIIISIINIIIAIFLIRKGVNVGIIMFLESIFIAFLSKMSLDRFIKNTFSSILDSDTISLLIVMFLILLVENIMRNTGMINNIVESLKNLFTDKRIAAFVMPAIIGMLPSPGGARFSCPIVDDVIDKNSTNINKAYINYWFRHIWMDAFILYPGIVLAAKICKVSVWDMFAKMSLFMLLSFVLGVLFCIKDIKKEIAVLNIPKSESLKKLILNMLPIILLIFGYLILIKYSKFGLEIASVFVIGGLLIIKKYDYSKIKDACKKAFQPNLNIIILGVMIFKGILFESGLIQNLARTIDNYGIPIEILYFLLPFIGGLTSGISVSFVSMSFPILSSLGLQSNIWFCVLAFVSGFAGVMLSPLHLCAVLTADYFKTKLEKLILKISITEIVIVFVVISLFYIF